MAWYQERANFVITRRGAALSCFSEILELLAMAGDIAERRRWGLKHGRTLSFPLTNFVCSTPLQKQSSGQIFQGQPAPRGLLANQIILCCRLTNQTHPPLPKRFLFLEQISAQRCQVQYRSKSDL
jgi:hypothetical protein